jgi:oligoendopeptidase F
MDASDWRSVAAVFEELEGRSIRSVEELIRWVEDRSELEAVLSEAGARLNNRQFQNTADQEARETFQRFLVEVSAPASRAFARLNERFVSSPYVGELPQARFAQYVRMIRNELELYREENVRLATEESAVAQRYNMVTGGLKAQLEGRWFVLPEMTQFLKDPDRGRRREAWEGVNAAWRLVEGEIDEILDELVAIRTRMARNAGFESYRDYRHRAMGRFDYTPEDCLRFHASIERHFVPLLGRRLALRKRRMGLDPLRPWDTAVDPAGRPPLRPFSSVEQLIDAVIEIRSRISPELGAMTRHQREQGLLDLETRPDKARVGYNAPLLESGWPFIFMNATGLHSDLVILLHESGHATHAYCMRDEPITAYRLTPPEASELASMSMELLSMTHWDLVYPEPRDHYRAAMDQLESIISGLPSTMMIDAFQHWMYTHPGHTHAERRACWRSLHERFSTGLVDYTGHEEVIATGYQRIPHLFFAPLYYIEYGIAQFGALQVWRNVLADREEGVARYMAALRLGSSRPLPEIYAAAGVRFDFSDALAAELAGFLEERLELYEERAGG